MTLHFIADERVRHVDYESCVGHLVGAVEHAVAPSTRDGRRVLLRDTVSRVGLRRRRPPMLRLLFHLLLLALRRVRPLVRLRSQYMQSR